MNWGIEMQKTTEGKPEIRQKIRQINTLVSVHRLKARPGATRWRIRAMRNRTLGQRPSTAVPLIGLGQGFRGSRLLLRQRIRIFLPTGQKGTCQEVGKGYLRGWSMGISFTADGSWLMAGGLIIGHLIEN